MSSVFVVTGCVDPDDPQPESVYGGGDGISDGNLDEADDSSDPGDPEPADSGGALLDFGTDPNSGGNTTGDEQKSDACKKIDFLFVVDNSGSMQDEQQHLVNSFPGFIETIQGSTAADDMQIMVIDTDDYLAPGEGVAGVCPAGVDCCPMICATYPYATCNNVPCSPNPPPPPTTCADQLGGGKLDNFIGLPCGVDSGERFMTSSQANLAQTFSCLAAVGTMGEGDERPMQALAAAIGPLAQAGACNDGFVRDDAVLVITIITDEEDDHESGDAVCGGKAQSGSSGDPQAWVDAVLAAKAGTEQNVVVLSLIGPKAAAPVCPPLDKCGGGFAGAEPAARIEQFTTEFTYGLVGQVCAANYESFFATAVGLVTEACEEFEPIG